MDKYAVLALCFLLVFQGVTQFIVISRATDYSVWRYHKVLTVTNSTALPVGYQLNFTLWKGVGVDSAGNFYLNNHANDNLWDLRFVDGNGILLDMWNQTAITGETHVHTWIELASSLVVVMYYGNEYANSEWDAATAVFERVIDSGVVAALPMDEASATATCVDYSDNGNNGAPTNTAIVAGKYGYARNFAGDNDQIVIASDASLDNFDELTVDAWVNFTAFASGGDHFIVTKSTGAVGSWQLDNPDGTDNIRFIFQTASGWTSPSQVDVPGLGVWVHVAATFKRNDFAILYINGAQGSNTSTFDEVLGSLAYATRVGSGNGDSFFEGVISGAHIFNVSLSGEVIADMYSFYPQHFSNHLGSIFLREWTTNVSTSSNVETDTQSTEVTTQQDVNWMAFVVLLVFAVLNVVLILIPRVYILNFVVAALTLAIAAATVNDATLPIQPYFSLIVALLSVLGILRAANLLRNQ